MGGEGRIRRPEGGGLGVVRAGLHACMHAYAPPPPWELPALPRERLQRSRRLRRRPGLSLSLYIMYVPGGPPSPSPPLQLLVVVGSLGPRSSGRRRLSRRGGVEWISESYLAPWSPRSQPNPPRLGRVSSSTTSCSSFPSNRPIRPPPRAALRLVLLDSPPCHLPLGAGLRLAQANASAGSAPRNVRPGIRPPQDVAAITHASSRRRHLAIRICLPAASSPAAATSFRLPPRFRAPARPPTPPLLRWPRPPPLRKARPTRLRAPTTQAMPRPVNPFRVARQP
eukprot:scaffold2156_cov430-Prasinococcus_capsulatus_cf.AAC.4